MSVSQSMPVVRGAPIVGSLLDMRRDRVGFLRRVAEEHGDIARARFGVFQVVVVSSAELAHEVLVTREDAFHKGFGLSVFGKPLLGDGLLTSEGDAHRRQRRLVAPAFVHKRVAEYAEVIGARADAALHGLRDGARIDLSDALLRLTFDIVGKTLFDADLAGEARQVGDALTEAMRSMMESLQSIVPIPPSIPTPHNLRARKAVARLDEVVYRLIRERRADGTDHGDFLSMLLLARDEEGGGRMDDKQVRDEAMTILLAGHETTSNALAWTFYLLGKHPAVRERLEREVDATLGGRVPTLADCARLPYAMQVFKEAMRLYPPAYLVTRRAMRDVGISGHVVAKNQVVIIDIVGMHHRAKYFADPERFDPDRFSPERERAQVKGAFLPFGAGPRVCIGNHFALMEGQLVLAHLAQHARFELAPESLHVVPEPLVTLRPKNGIHVRIARRTAAATA